MDKQVMEQQVVDQQVVIAGIGPGHQDYITPAALEAIRECHVLIGGRRNLAQFAHLHKEEVVIGTRLDELMNTLRNLLETGGGRKKLVVLASGDPGLYSISQTLKQQLPEVAFSVIPGISALQVLCARCHIPWDQVHLTSLHGREPVAVAPIVRKHPKTVFFTGGNTSPEGVCRELVREGLNHVKVTVGENLSYETERMITGTPETIAALPFDSLCVMLVEREDEATPHIWEYNTPGIPDHHFVRGEVPMTKEEVRAVVMAKLRLKPRDVVYDIGAGTGSVAVECGHLVPQGQVFAIEQHETAIDLIRRNIEAQGLTNVVPVAGRAPEKLEGLPKAHRVFIGGTGGNMTQILDTIAAWDHPCRVVITAVVLETVAEALEDLQMRGFEQVEVVNLAVSRGRRVGNRHMMQALNPVTIISGEHQPCMKKEVRP